MSKSRHIHFIGIGGIIMSALAQYFLTQGNKVTGSDTSASDTTGFLKGLGITVYESHAASNVDRADEIIHTAAVKPGNVEFDEAKRRSIPTKLTHQVIGELTKIFQTVAITGSHGKSTTTAMTAKILIDAGLDPTVLIGTKMNELNGNNFRLGKSKWLIVEADDYNRHFHYYHPYMAAITNIDREHLDIYGDLAGVTEAFREFIRKVDPKGLLVVNGQDKLLPKLAHELPEPKPDVIIYNHTDVVRHETRVAGKHNQSNAEAAFQLAKWAGVDEPTIRQSLAEFAGTWRRLEELQEGVFSDYAHHPTEIKATLQGLKEANPDKRLICVFQPHQRDRLIQLFDDFISAFDVADQTILIPLYVVRGRDESTGKDSNDLVKAIHKTKVHFAKDFNSAYNTVSKYFRPDHIVVFMGAGDIDEKLRSRLA